MASRNQDIWLWIGLGKEHTSIITSDRSIVNLLSGILSYCAARAAHRQLLAVRTATQITQDNKPQDILSQRTENGLQATHG